MAFLAPVAGAIGGMFGGGAAGATAAGAGAAGAAGAGLSGAAGASLAPAAMASSMGYAAPIAAGAAASSALPAAAAPAAGGFLSGAMDSIGLTTAGKFDTTKAGGLVGSLLGQAATQPGQTPGAPDVRMADFPQAVQQAMGQKPWATGQYDSYLKQLMGGG